MRWPSCGGAGSTAGRTGARQIGPDWLGRFDLLLAMDRSNERDLRLMAAGRPELDDRIRLMRSFDPEAPAGAEVPDPYGGGPRGVRPGL